MDRPIIKFFMHKRRDKPSTEVSTTMSLFYLFCHGSSYYRLSDRASDCHSSTVFRHNVHTVVTVFVPRYPQVPCRPTTFYSLYIDLPRNFFSTESFLCSLCFVLCRPQKTLDVYQNVSMSPSKLVLHSRKMKGLRSLSK